MPPAPEARIPDWCRVHDHQRYHGLIKQKNSDFEVVEQLGFVPSGQGGHSFLLIEKDGANTAWVAEQLARYAGARAVDVGFAGLKDRHAVTRQWFSVLCKESVDWSVMQLPGVNIVDATRHEKKLRRGAHQRNEFRIAVRDFAGEERTLAPLLEKIAQSGIPNYFGPQRFGRDGNNLALVDLLVAGKRLRRQQRGLAISVARAFVFNCILEARVRDGTWNQAMPGEALQLAGSNSFFTADVITEEIESRLADFDIHPTAALWGAGAAGNAGASAASEAEVVSSHAAIRDVLLQCASMSRRATRVRPDNLKWHFRGTALLLEFSLPRGSYATALLREIVA